MELQFRKLSSEMIDTFFDYFDRIGFTDYMDFSMCYCLESHVSASEDNMLDTKEKRQKKATDLIKTGKLSGYLIYCDDHLMGWCNADDKMNYEPIMADEEHRTIDVEKGLVKVIYCIEIAPQYRGMGLSHSIIEYIINTAKEEGFSYVEAYPFSDRSYEYQYHGPVRLYEKHGFKVMAEKSWFYIVQKELCSPCS